MVYSLLTASRNFNDRWIGHERLVRNGLHGYRMKAAQLCAGSRRLQVAWRRSPWAKSIRQQGYAEITNFLPDDTFARLRQEVEKSADAVRRICPPRDNRKPGFNPPEQHDWGYDRFDGGTLNRFIRTDPDSMPEVHSFCRNSMLSQLSRLIVGLPVRASNVRIYETVNGDEGKNRDIQKDFHRDTFFSSMKFWYFLDEVKARDGPFVYVPESHRLTPERIAWENEMACAAVDTRLRTGHAGGGAFRITEENIHQLGLPEPKYFTVAPNTMVIADTLGFHRRGDGDPGSRRLAIYASNRPLPFFPIGL